MEESHRINRRREYWQMTTHYVSHVCTVFACLVLGTACRTTQHDLLDDYDHFAEGHLSWHQSRLNGLPLADVLLSLGLDFKYLSRYCEPPGRLVALTYTRQFTDETERIYIWIRTDEQRTSLAEDWSSRECENLNVLGITVRRVRPDGSEYSPVLEKWRVQSGQPKTLDCRNAYRTVGVKSGHWGVRAL